MFDFAEFAARPPFSMPKAEKGPFYTLALRDLTEWHRARCAPYRRVVDGLGYAPENMRCEEDFPFLPVSAFKKHELRSVDRAEVVKTMTSSGTTGQAVSKIFLDRETSANQTKTLAKIASEFLGGKRMPMLVVDSRNVLKDRNMFSARGAGILGFSMLGRDATYALDEEMNLDWAALGEFLEKYRGQTIFLFGFTFMIWEYFYKPLLQNPSRLTFSDGVLIHGGGWKKLQNEAVDSVHFRAALRDVCGISKVYNYYGMVEQTGSIFMECEHERLHCSNFSDVAIRRYADFSPAEVGEEGLVQAISLLPKSYPGHSLLTEDRGYLLGEDDCPCGRMGKTFSVTGRIQHAEIRGCSDTYERT